MGDDDSDNSLHYQATHKMPSAMIVRDDSDNRLRYQTIMDDGSESDGDDVVLMMTMMSTVNEDDDAGNRLRYHTDR